ncbi:hypothetical protein ACQ4PT_034313 [Festuca glaucescens]
MSSNSSIVGFFARAGDLIDAIGLYVKIEREPMEKQDLITKAGLWGSDSGQHHDVDVVMLDHSEIVKEAFGTIGLDTITSLSFVTNIATYGPFGGGGGMPFRSTVHDNVFSEKEDDTPSLVQDNYNIVGFYARAEQHINAIGFYMAPIKKQDTDGAACTNPKIEDDIKNLDKAFITKIGPWGGCKGNHKDIEVPPLCLNSITIRSGEVVYSLTFSYKDDTGKHHHAGPWGALEGFSSGSFDTIQLGPLEFLTEVSGTIGSSSKYSSNVLTEVSGTTDFSSHNSYDVVTSVMFITNSRRYGPYGGGGGIPFHSPLLSSGSIVGFFAHAERVVDAIGLYVNIDFEPTNEQDLVMKVGPWGGDSGSPNDVDVLPRRLISVLVHSGKVINSIAFTYSDCNGQEHTAGPWGRTGDPADESSHMILLNRFDFLMEVSGTIGRSSEGSEVVTSLLFVTNTGSYGPYGKGGGTQFRSPLQTDGSIVGFFANAEDVIDAIGVYFSYERETVIRVDIKSAASVLEHIILDRTVEPTNVPLALLQHITEEFAEKRQIGRGGFGVVYKGDLQNGSVAVKRLSNTHTIEEELFYREATSMISVKHENIVRLLGYCANTEGQAMINPEPGENMKFIFAEIRERLLCFEYIRNGSLDKYLTDELTGLEWHTRYQIIKGICNGLDYLHNEKDFGISKFLDGATHVVTSNSAMSFGYTAPEFIQRGVVSFKSDVYSLGVIIMELVTGCKGDPDIKNVLRRWRHRWNKSGKYSPFGHQQVSKCIEIALTCLSYSPNKRPHVRDILCMLNAIESMDDQIISAGESPVGPISPYPWELLEFDKHELNFPFEINKQIPCSLELTNVTDNCVAFDMQNTGMLRYCIEPNKGVVPARSKCIVIITLQPREAAPHDTMCKDELVVQCAAVIEGLTAENIHEDMFDNKSGNFVDEVTLTVVISRVAITE